MNEMAQAADTSVRRSSAAKFVPELVEHFKENTIQMILALVREVIVECGKSVLDTEVRPAFASSGYVMRGYMPNLRHADLKK